MLRRNTSEVSYHSLLLDKEECCLSCFPRGEKQISSIMRTEVSAAGVVWAVSPSHWQMRRCWAEGQLLNAWWNNSKEKEDRLQRKCTGLAFWYLSLSHSVTLCWCMRGAGTLANLACLETGARSRLCLQLHQCTLKQIFINASSLISVASKLLCKVNQTNKICSVIFWKTRAKFSH